MTTERETDLLDEAIRWHVRLAEASEADWIDFTAWLEADPAHGRAYDRIESADAELDGAEIDGAAANPVPIAPPVPLEPLPALNDNPAKPGRARWIAGLALAASLALAAFFGFNLMPSGQPYEIVTAPGETRSVTLASGDRIELNGATRLSLDRDQPRFARIETGEATFTVLHMTDDPFVVLSGDSRIEDIGTIFNVVTSSEGLRVAVAEGSVIYNPGREGVTLAAGQALHAPSGPGDIAVSPIEPSRVGMWRKGRLSYVGEPLSRVAADLARQTGEQITLDPALERRTFTGTIRIGTDRDELFKDLSQLLNIDARRDADGWKFSDPG